MYTVHCTLYINVVVHCTLQIVLDTSRQLVGLVAQQLAVVYNKSSSWLWLQSTIVPSSWLATIGNPQLERGDAASSLSTNHLLSVCVSTSIYICISVCVSICICICICICNYQPPNLQSYQRVYFCVSFTWLLSCVRKRLLLLHVLIGSLGKII